MFTHANSRSLLVDAPDPGVILNSMPSRAIAGNGFNVAIRHTEATTKALRTMGMPAPSPIMSYYSWPKFMGKYDPFTHQKAMAEFMTLYKRCFNLSEMGTTKTNATLWAADWMLETNQVDKFVIVAPLSTLQTVWQIGIFQTLMHRKCVILHGARDKRLNHALLDVDFYIINPEGLKDAEMRKRLFSKAKGRIHIIVDEGGKLYRNSQTDKYKSFEKCLEDRGLWWLTGTPCPGGPSDAWAQARLVSPARVPRTFGSFRRDTMTEVTDHKWVPKPEGRAIAFRAMQPAIRFEKSECLELPPVTTIEMQAEMSAAQKKAVKSMTDDMIAEARDWSEHHVTITAVNAGDRINKLRQLLLGSVKAGDEYIDIDAKPRLGVLDDAMEMAEGKIIVIVPFKGAMKVVADHIRAGGRTAEIINGDVSITARNRIIADYKTLPHPQVLVCHPQVMAHGLNLTEADVLIFYGPIYSNDDYRQVVERFNRPGQTRKMTIVRIGCHALDWKIYAMPDSKEQVQAAILAMYRDVVGDAYKMAA